MRHVELQEEPTRFNILTRSVELQNMFPVQSSEQTLGYVAVVLANRHAAVVLEMSQYEEETHEYQSYAVKEKMLRESIEKEVTDARQVIAAITPHNEDYLTTYMDAAVMDARHMKTMIKLAEQRAGIDVSWKDWLAHQTSNFELLSFLQFHNHLIEQQQTDEGVAELVAFHKAEFAELATRLYEKDVIATGPDGLDSVAMKVGDIFDTAMKERIGYYQRDEQEAFYVQQGYRTDALFRPVELLSRTTEVMTHELVHATIGESYKRADGPLSARWINEAITETIAALIENGRLHGNWGEDAYRPERQLLHRLLSGPTEETVKNRDSAYQLALHAYSGSAEKVKEFTDYLDSMWHETDVLGTLNEDITREEQLHKDSDGVIRDAGQIQAVEAALELLRKKYPLQ